MLIRGMLIRDEGALCEVHILIRWTQQQAGSNTQPLITLSAAGARHCSPE